MQHYSPHLREIPQSTHTKDAFDAKTYPKMLPSTMPEPLLNNQSDDFDRFGLNTRSSRRDERVKVESSRLHEIKSYIPQERLPQYIYQSNNNFQNNSNQINNSSYSRLKKSNGDIDKEHNIRDLLPGTCNILHVYDIKSEDTRRIHKTNEITDREPMRNTLNAVPNSYS